jgi:hypothetical protein
MYADPQSITVGGGAKTFVRIGSTTPATKGSFQTTDGAYRLDINQNKSANRFRHEARLTLVKVAADPISAVNKQVSASIIVTIDEPLWGFSDADLIDGVTGLFTLLNASTYAKTQTLLNGEL